MREQRLRRVQRQPQDDPRAVGGRALRAPTASPPSSSTATTSRRSSRSPSSAVRRCREGDGPVLIEAETYRWHGHYEGDAQPYKPEDEAAGWNDRDPLSVAGANIVGAGLETEARLQELRDEAQAVVEAAVEAARAADPPALEEAYEHVYRD